VNENDARKLAEALGWTEDACGMWETGAVSFTSLGSLSSTIAGAWLVVEAMRKRGWSLSLYVTHNKVAAYFDNRNGLEWAEAFSATCPTAPEAICKAALKAMEA